MLVAMILLLFVELVVLINLYFVSYSALMKVLEYYCVGVVNMLAVYVYAGVQ